jgi:hypothetical protein
MDRYDLIAALGLALSLAAVAYLAGPAWAALGLGLAMLAFAILSARRPPQP